MTSDKQLKANQANAKRSTGPKTAAGKGKVSQNSIKHGALSDRPVIPGLESQEEWDRHLAETLADLQPEGRVANWLAQRIASYQWRLRRVARYEAEATAVGLESAERDFAREEFGWETVCGLEELPLVKAKKRVEELRASSELLQELPDLPANQAVPDCTQLVSEALDLAGTTLAPGGLQSYVDTITEWTAELMREMLQAIAQHRTMNPGNLLELMITRVTAKLEAAQRRYEDLVRTLDQYRRERAIPDGHVLEKISRYEGHLERGLYKALHEFREFQKQRAGQRAPAARKN